jgi:hypothetical protein
VPSISEHSPCRNITVAPAAEGAAGGSVSLYAMRPAPSGRGYTPSRVLHGGERADMLRRRSGVAHRCWRALLKALVCVSRTMMESARRAAS